MCMLRSLSSITARKQLVASLWSSTSSHRRLLVRLSKSLAGNGGLLCMAQHRWVPMWAYYTVSMSLCVCYIRILKPVVRWLPVGQIYVLWGNYMTLYRNIECSGIGVICLGYACVHWQYMGQGRVVALEKWPMQWPSIIILLHSVLSACHVSCYIVYHIFTRCIFALIIDWGGGNHLSFQWHEKCWRPGKCCEEGNVPTLSLLHCGVRHCTQEQ